MIYLNIRKGIIMGQLNLEYVWNEFSSGLRSFIVSRVKNESDADDILQDVFLKIHNNLQNLKDQSRIRPWVYQITRNLIADHFRSRNINYTETEIPDISDFPGSSLKLMDTAVEDLIQMMDELSPEFCEALCLTEIEGLSQKEYAERKGLSYSGAKSRVQRARIMLKDLLFKCCHYQFDRYGTVIDIQPNCCCCCDHRDKTEN